MNACHPKKYTLPGFDSRQAERTTQRQPPPLLLAPVEDKTVELDFDGGRLSSDAGLVLLKDIDDQLGLTRALAAVLADSRDARRIHFTPEDLLKQRIFQIAAGYEDANDANTLRHDPICKLLLDRLPETGAPLASQPTISRFENSVSRTAIYRMALVISFAFSAGERSSIFRLLMIYGQIWGTPWCGKNSRLIPALTRGPRHITLSWRRPLSLIPKDKKARN
jgi:hypothetical protein